MVLYIPCSIFHLAWLLYVRPETSEPYHVHDILTFLLQLSLKMLVTLWINKLPYCKRLRSSHLTISVSLIIDFTPKNLSLIHTYILWSMRDKSWLLINIFWLWCCHLVASYKCFRGKYCLHLRSIQFFYVQDTGHWSPWNRMVTG